MRVGVDIVRKTAELLKNASLLRSDTSRVVGTQGSRPGSRNDPGRRRQAERQGSRAAR